MPTLPLRAAAVAALLLLAACGQAESAATSPSAVASRAPGGGNGRAGGPPGVNGLIAALDGKTLQVQTGDAQTAVTYSASTTITATVPAAAADVKAGACVVVRPVDSSAAPDATAVTAASVQVSEPVDGRCTGGFGGPGRPGGFGQGQGQGTRPTARPSRPAGGGNRARGFGVVGTVASVSGSGFVVQAISFGRGGATPAPPRPVTVTTSGSTTYAKTAKATASALAVGKCVFAAGKSDDTGTVAATTIAVRDADNGTCGNPRGNRPGDAAN